MNLYVVWIHPRPRRPSACAAGPAGTSAVLTDQPDRAVSGADVLVLDARLRQSLVAVRSLGRRGLRVAALETRCNVPAFASRWCRRAFACRAGLATDAYLACLERVLASAPARVLIPSHDGTIALLRRHRSRLEQHVRVALADERALALAINKDLTLEVAKGLGIRVPPGVVVHEVGAVPVALKAIGLPAVVKPTESWVWGKDGGFRVASRLVTTPAEARDAVAELTCFGGGTLFQQLLTGRREAISFIYAGGQVRARFAQWAKRTWPPLGGVSVLRQSIPFPQDIGDQAERLVREIDLEGYSEVEFRRDADGVPYLMEINPRLSGSVEIAVRSGVDFPNLLYQWASGEPVQEISAYAVGGWMRDLQGDLSTTIDALKERGRPGVSAPTDALRDFCVSFLKPTHYDYLDWKDLVPAITATADFTRVSVIRVIRKALRAGGLKAAS